jgi:hypothetical protein
VIDVDEIKEKKLFSDFDHFFAKLSNLIREVRAERTERPTWELSDKLGLTQGGVLLKTLVKAFKLSWDEAVESAVSLKSFAVRDIRKKKS